MSKKQFEESSLNDYKRYGEPWDQILFLAADAYDMDLPLFMEMLAAGPDPEMYPELAALTNALPKSSALHSSEDEASPKIVPPMPPRRRKLYLSELAEMFGPFPEECMPRPERDGHHLRPEFERIDDRVLTRSEAPVLERS